MKTVVASDICGAIMGLGTCGLCEGRVGAHEGVRYCGRRRKQWGDGIYPSFGQPVGGEVLSFEWKSSGNRCKFVRYTSPNEAKKSR